MKKKYLLGVLAVILCLCACSNENEGTVDDALNKLSKDNNFSSEWNGENYINFKYRYGESEDAFYYVNAQQMYYINKNECKMILMCTKPECDHIIYKDNERVYGCEALYADNMDVQVYNGKLYADGQLENENVQSLIVSNVDGTDKTVAIHNINKRWDKELENLADDKIYNVVGSTRWTIYEDIVYVYTSIGASGGNNMDFYIDKYDLNTGEYIGELFNRTFEGSNLNTQEVIRYDNKILLKLSLEISANEVEHQEKEMYLEVDMVDGSASDIKVPSTKTEALYNGKVIYQPKADNVYETDSNNQPKVCIELNDFEKECGVLITSLDKYLLITPLFIYAPETEKITYYTKVYDENYKLLETIELPEDVLPMAGCSNEILLRARNDEMFAHRYFGIDASQIGTGNVEVKEYTVNKMTYNRQ